MEGSLLFCFNAIMIDVFFEETEVFSLPISLLNNWISDVCVDESSQLTEVSIIFCSDDYLLAMNIEHLNHDYYTDVITFDYSEENSIAGDLFISVDRVKENALNFNVDFKHELFRVIIHGVLHLLGYKDKSEDDILLMRSKENFYLNLINFDFSI